MSADVKPSPVLDGVAGVVLVVFAVYVVGESAGFRGNSGFLPTMLGWTIGLGGLVLVVQSGITVMRSPPRPGRRSWGAGGIEKYLLPSLLFLLTVVYVLLIPRLGYYISSALYMPIILFLLGSTGWVVHVTTIGSFLLVLYVIFERMLSVSFPPAICCEKQPPCRPRAARSLLMSPDMYAGLIQAFAPYNLLAALVGTVLGIVFGALPGLTAATAIALLVPMTFGMPADASLIMLTPSTAPRCSATAFRRSSCISRARPRPRLPSSTATR
jgi:hypothetical protein